MDDPEEPTGERSTLSVLGPRPGGVGDASDGAPSGTTSEGEDLRIVDAPRPGPVARRVSMATRLAFVVLAVTIVSLLITSIAGLAQGQDLGEALGRARLEAVREAQAAQVVDEVAQATSQSAALASSPATAEAITRFSDAFAELSVVDEGQRAEQSADLRAYYREEVIPVLQEARGTSVSVSETLPVTPEATYLQDTYIADSPAAAGREASVDDADDGSTWSQVHGELHPGFRETARQLRVGDLYLVDAAGDVVYTTAKRTELGTSLEVGPHSGSTLAALFEDLRRDPEAAAVRVADFAPYGPAGDDPAGFVASPVLEDGTFVGMVAFELPARDLRRLMTNGGDWEGLGLGETGETYLVADNGTLRSESRDFLEDPDRYLEDARDAGTLDRAEAEQVERGDTTILVQRANPDTVRAALAGEGLESGVNYLGRDVISAYTPLDLPDLDWAIVAEVETDELDEPVADYGGGVVIAVAVFVVVLTFLATIWAGRLTAPLRVISNRLRRVDEAVADGPVDFVATARGGGEQESDQELPANSPREFVELSNSFDDMLDTLEARRRDVVAAHDERVDLLRRFLPPTVARRVEQGDREVLDRIPNATVVAVTLRGLGALVRRGSAEENRRALESVLNELDADADEHGLERVKLTGDTYIATCGVNRPFLDHAPRCVRFALQVREGLADLDDFPAGIQITAGVHSGPVTVGLTGSMLLVYDTWGPTVSRARRIGRAGRPGAVLVTDETRAQLPPTVEVRPSDGEEVWEVTGFDTPEEAES